MEKNPDQIDNDEHVLTFRWKPDIIGETSDSVSISIWAYQELDRTLYPKLYWLTDLSTGVSNTGRFQIDLNQLPKLNLRRYDYHFGFIGVNVTGNVISPTLWSKPTPMGWLFRLYWRREFGTKWQYNFCRKWFNREVDNEYFATTLFRCPCTLEQAELDKGRFAPDEQCNVIDRKCDSRFKGAQHCVRTARPS